ncbi:hypothetical protein IU433_02260 [Nocardia puris]|uniref:Uncharacterized protein n=1 Tax=Nocardia puris TaxID=208602 RepID=A0A366DXX0_9NOCA|nr:hypothetical protein [Nocardia puris]MBF6210610.1 hypothetical protein [Nocardia puris]MBF6369336.1 hypothetical protein [Nocardia puris]MBF6457871.1 hypothetical protein [Nocardia puris]RBO94038.1 hypothetical protein DFR74_102458 [Nocardia puris]
MLIATLVVTIVAFLRRRFRGRNRPADGAPRERVPVRELITRTLRRPVPAAGAVLALLVAAGLFTQC